MTIFVTLGLIRGGEGRLGVARGGELVVGGEDTAGEGEEGEGYGEGEERGGEPDSGLRTKIQTSL